MDFSLPCRTCLECGDAAVYVNITKKCHLNNSVRDVIVMLVPQMADSLCDADSICENCFNTLAGCMRFIEKCMEVEDKIKREQSTDVLELVYDGTGDVVDDSTEEYSGTSEPKEDKIKREQSGDVLELDCAGGSTEEYGGTSEHQEEQSYSRNDVKIESSDSIMQAFPKSITEHNRILSLQQPNGVIMQNFISDLAQSGINILQVSKDPKESISSADYSYNGSTNKRILLLGTHIFNLAYKCPNCPKHLQNQRKYTSHIVNCKKVPKIKEKKEPQKCPFCDKVIKNKMMEGHLKRHEERQRKLELPKERKEYKKRVLQCRICLERFTTKEEYEFHIEIHPPYVCDQCGKGFSQNSSLSSHKKTHNNPNSFICEICGKGYKDHGMLRVHRQTHENTKFKCNLCPKIFQIKSRLTRHVKNVHNTGGTVQCTQCGKLFKNRAIHDSHVRLIHLKIKPYKCEVCGKEFGRSDYLVHHKVRHTCQPNKYVPKKLDIGGKYNELSLPCKFCGKRFRGIPKMKMHLETHIKIRRFPCQFCPLTFARKQICKKHELSHKSFERFFRCNICWCKLPSREDLDAHVKTKHNNPRYTCTTCGEMFHRAYLLNHHNLLEHRTPEDTEKAKQIIHDSLLEIAAAESEI